MFDQVFFWLSTLLTVFGAVMVVVQKNLMHACIFLLCSLIGVAGLYVTLNADFVAGTQLVVYVGGVIILMLFAIMLTGGNNTKTLAKIKIGFDLIHPMGNFKTYILAFITGAVFISATSSILIRFFRGQISQKALPFYETTVEKIGVKLITDHVLVFELSSVLLLGALIGAAIIARPKRTKWKEN